MSGATARYRALCDQSAERIVRRQATVRAVAPSLAADLAAVRRETTERISRARLSRPAPPVPGVLIVDDHEALAEIMAATLRAAMPELPVHVAHDLASADALVGEHNPRVLIVDVNLGHELGSGLAYDRHPGRVVILTSGAIDADALVAEAYDCGAMALPKPPDGLVDIVRAALDPMACTRPRML